MLNIFMMLCCVVCMCVCELVEFENVLGGCENVNENTDDELRICVGIFVFSRINKSDFMCYATF